MKLSPLALAVFASTALVSVTSADVNGGVRGSGSIDQASTHRALQEGSASKFGSAFGPSGFFSSMADMWASFVGRDDN